MSAVLAAALTSVSCRPQPDTTFERVRAEIEPVLESGPPDTFAKARDREHLQNELEDFYRARDHFSAWHNGTKITDAGRAALRTLGRADEHGLRVGDYVRGELAAGDVARERQTAEAAARFDVALSAAAILYIRDIHEGRISPEEAGLELEVTHHHPKLADELTQIVSSASGDEVGEALEAFAPPYPAYDGLKTALARYRELQESDRWPSLADARTIHPGEAYGDADRLRERLRLMGDLAGDSAGSGLEYDAPLVEAVTRFQMRHSLNPDGVIGRETFAALNVPWSRRVEQIVASMERWRWVSGHFTGKAILVNIPEFELRSIETSGGEYRVSFESRVIVGQHYAELRTPIFTGKLAYLDFRPFWNVPESIVREELYERLDESGYLETYHYEIVRDLSLEAKPLPASAENVAKVRAGALQLRQRPGPGNALGLVKFIFPNRYSVFLHATPEMHLFQREERAFSHGCVRVADAAGLAEWVLEDQEGWDRRAIAKAIASGPTTRVPIETDIAVYIVYLTAHVDDETGVVHFGRDIYGLDAELLAALG
ncbi:MAG TPA: L,D-transpeptidase family protein [Vicinamibacteria bacterium]|nr:L,D-transpeptidase family protein [Vicinamibacteria bacterium]